ncbi:MAG TPA: YraN family protein [Stellaceae bacterium]|jgi:putative endonuclease|nr:YraN family protein [Stellaceae bacterium]
MKGYRRPASRRHRAERWGRIAERLCRWHLRLRGWRIIAADWRCPSGEIDIVARRRGVLAIVEVKSRRDLDTAAESLLPRQRRRIARATTAFLSMRPELAVLTLRFDVMLVAPLRPPRHLANAWRADE